MALTPINYRAPLELLGFTWHEQFALLFRDYVTHSAQDHNLYESRKYSVAAKYRDDKSTYTWRKAPTLLKIMEQGVQWEVNTER